MWQKDLSLPPKYNRRVLPDTLRILLESARWEGKRFDRRGICSVLRGWDGTPFGVIEGGRLLVKALV
jgi:hypothetical protein